MRVGEGIQGVKSSRFQQVQTSGRRPFLRCPVLGRAWGGRGTAPRGCAGEGQADERRREHSEAYPQACSGKDGGGLIEKLAERMCGSGPMAIAGPMDKDRACMKALLIPEARMMFVSIGTVVRLATSAEG
jgi:hypothetical protein